MQLLPEEPLPTELLELQKFINFCLRDISKFQKDRYKEVLDRAVKYMKKRYKEIFENHQKYTKEQIAEQIFQVELKSDCIDLYKRCSWQAIEICLLDFSSRIIDIDNSVDLNLNFLKSEINYLQDILSGIFEFLSDVEVSKDNKRNGYGYHRRNLANSCEVFQSSIDHISHRLKFDTFSSFFNPSISVFLIRQSIEIRMKNALGIISIHKNNGEILRITPDHFIKFIYRNEHIKCIGVNKSLVKKIHKWSNHFIHGGFLMPSWQIWFAQYILRPLFSDGQKNIDGTVSWSLHGAIQIDKSYYNGLLEDEIKSFICNEIHQVKKLGLKPDELYIEKMSPEALLT